MAAPQPPSAAAAVEEQLHEVVARADSARQRARSALEKARAAYADRAPPRAAAAALRAALSTREAEQEADHADAAANSALRALEAAQAGNPAQLDAAVAVAVGTLSTAAGHAAAAYTAATAAESAAVGAATATAAGTEEDRLLRRLGRAAGLMRGSFGSQSRADAAARIAQSGGFALIQDYIRERPETSPERLTSIVETVARFVALGAALLLFGGAVAVYLAVEDVGVAPTATSTSASDTSTTGSTGSTPTDTTATSTTDTSSTGATASTSTDTTTTSATGTSTTGGTGTTPADTTSNSAPATVTAAPTTAAPDERAHSHPASVPIALVAAGTLLLLLGLLAPRARSVSASKDAISLTLDAEEDPFTRLAKVLPQLIQQPPGAGAGSDKPPPATAKVVGPEGVVELPLEVESSPGEHLLRFAAPGEHRLEHVEITVPARAVSPATATPVHPAVTEKAIEMLAQAALASASTPRRRLWPFGR